MGSTAKLSSTSILFLFCPQRLLYSGRFLSIWNGFSYNIGEWWSCPYRKNHVFSISFSVFWGLVCPHRLQGLTVTNDAACVHADQGFGVFLKMWGSMCIACGNIFNMGAAMPSLQSWFQCGAPHILLAEMLNKINVITICVVIVYVLSTAKKITWTNFRVFVHVVHVLSTVIFCFNVDNNFVNK